MDAERWRLVEQLCQEALERPEEQQTVFLESVCGTDLELRQEVASLLANRGRAESFIETPAIQMAARALATEQADHPAETSRHIGRIISHYKIVEKLASGGMGDVYRALRADGTYDKQVAIKMIQGARSTDFFLTRFQNERQILADLDHPNIARLLDGGTTEEGLPYLVMEFIQGLPIDEYCAQKSLTIRQRLELFRVVCSAVQYAHQNLVVHRDLKPSNILVTSDGVPKLLDFGIAKILNPQRGEESLQQTVTMFRMLTLDYASPEQVRNEPVSTASDVYSLGVILYVLLTGQSPYRLQTDSPQELLQAICDNEPEKPSAAATRGPAQEVHTSTGSSEPVDRSTAKEDNRKKLQRVLSGDLDNIVLKALKKESKRRYPSVEQFSEDIRRYLTGMPVLAHPDSPAYRTRKFIGRHKLAVSGTALLFVSLASGLIATLWQARIARGERARAERRFNDVRNLANSLIFEIHDSIGNLPGATPARKVLLERALEYLDSLARESGGDSSLQRELATAYQRIGQLQGSSLDANLGNTEAGLLSYQKAMAIWESLAKMNPFNLNDQLNLAKGHRILSNMISSTGRPGARDQLEEALEITGRLMKSNSSAESLLRERFIELEWLAGYYDDAEDYGMAVGLSRNALTIAENLSKANPQDPSLRSGIAVNRVKIANELAAAGSRREALDMNRSGLELFELLAEDSSDAPNRRKLGVSLWFRGNILMTNGDTHEALESYRRSLTILEMLEKNDPQNALYHQDVAGATAGVGWAMERQGRQAEGVAMLNRAIRILEEIHKRNPTYTDVPYVLGQIQIWKGEALAKVGNAHDALDSYQKGLANLEISMHGSLTPKSKCQVAAAHAKVAQALSMMKKTQESLENYEKALQMTEPLATAKPPNVLALYVVADAYSGLGDIAYESATRARIHSQEARYWKEAGSWYEKSLGISREIPRRGAVSPEGFEIADIAQVRNRLARSNVALTKLNSPSGLVMESQKHEP